ncbi:MAG: nucleotidyltransferase [Clostridia bacterium]|nr:nucleotidyltransferase [Clostridia bacterium]
MNKRPELVVLAAGMGSRYGGLKQIDAIDDRGHIMIDYSIYDAMRAGFKDFTFIIKHAIEDDFKAVMNSHLAGKDINVKYVFQEIDKIPEGYKIPEGRVKPWGTAHALLCCRGVVDAPFAVINADDYYGANAFTNIYNFLSNVADTDKYHYCMVGYRIKNTVTEKGTVARGICSSDERGMLTEVTERTSISSVEGRIYYTEDGVDYPLNPNSLVSMNLWGFTPSFIEECAKRFPAFLEEKVPKNPEKSEFYIPGVVDDLIKEGKADVKVLENTDKWHGVTYKEDKPDVLRAFIELRESGVYPDNF